MFGDANHYRAWQLLGITTIAFNAYLSVALAFREQKQFRQQRLAILLQR